MRNEIWLMLRIWENTVNIPKLASRGKWTPFWSTWLLFIYG